MFLQFGTTLRAVLRRFIVLTLLMAPTVAISQNFQWMHLLAPDVGWIASNSSLLWTTDNGQHWNNVTPTRTMSDERIVSVFFLDISTGWVLLSHYQIPQPGFDLAFTQDSGATWSTTPLRLPSSPIFVTQAHIQFLDAAHGWMNLSVESSSAYHSGVLFKTVDGGKNWSLCTANPGTTGELRFITDQNGWIVSPDGRELWVTHDGSATWTPVVLRPSAGVHPSDVAQYQLPLFRDNKHGLLVVRFHAFPTAPDADAEGSQLVLFATSDGGGSWKFDRFLVHLPTAGKSFATTLADSSLLTAHPTGEALTLKRFPLVGQAIDPVEITSAVASSTVLSLSFITEQRGWALAAKGSCSVGILPCTHVLSTDDAGARWNDITPGNKTGRSAQAPAGKPIRTIWQRAGVLKPLSGDEVSMHLGFDSCNLYNPTQMQDLWSNRSYQDVGFYMGDFTHINCDAPSPTYVSCILGSCCGGA